MRKNYSQQDYETDRRFVQAVKAAQQAGAVQVDNLHDSSQTGLLKKIELLGTKYRMLRASQNEGGGVSIATIEARIKNPAGYKAHLRTALKQRFYPDNPSPGNGLEQLVDEAVRINTARINNAFTNTYNHAKKRILKYEQKTAKTEQPAELAAAPKDEKAKQETMTGEDELLKKAYCLLALDGGQYELREQLRRDGKPHGAADAGRVIDRQAMALAKKLSQKETDY